MSVERSYEYYSATPTIFCDELSGFLSDCNIVVKAFDWQYNKNNTCGPRIYGDMELIYILAGESIVTVDGVVYHGYANDMFVIPQFAFAQINTNQEDPHENYWMHLQISDPLRAQRLAQLLGGPLLHLGEDKPLRELYRWLDAYNVLRGNGSYLTIQGLAQLILMRVIGLVNSANSLMNAPLFPTAESRAADDLLQKSIRLINDCRGNISVNELSDRLFVSSAYIRRVYRQRLGMTPLTFIRSVRMREAEILLLSTDESVGAISAKLGFSSTHHFYNEFRHFHSISPAAYRDITTERAKKQHAVRAGLGDFPDCAQS